MASTKASMYGLILSYLSRRQPSLVDGQEMIDQPVSQHPCSERRWRDAYAKRKEDTDCTVHGRYRQGVVELFLDDMGQELQGLRQFLVSRGAIVQTYHAGASDNRVQPHREDNGSTDMSGSVADLSTPEKATLDEYKHALLGVITTDYPDVRHIVLTEPGTLDASLLLVIVPETIFERAYQMLITGKLAAITTNEVRYAVVGLYEKEAEDQQGNIAFCCSSDQALHLFNRNGEHAVLKVIDTRGVAKNYPGPPGKDEEESSLTDQCEMESQDAGEIITGQQTKT